MAEERKDFEVRDFDTVELRWFGDMIVTQGQGESLTVEGDAELLQKLAVRVEGGSLILEIGQDWLERLVEGLRFIGRRPLTYRIGVDTLRRIGVSGRGSIRAEALRADDLTLAISGQGSVHIDDLQARELHVKINGRGEIEARGKVDEARIDIAGSGEVELPELTAQRAEVRISGHGEAELRVVDSLNVTISGYGRVRYHGDPKLTQSIAGAGNVRRQGD
jgi:hypothetical protein